MKSILAAAAAGVAIIAGCSQNSGKSEANTPVKQEQVHQTIQAKAIHYKCPECGYGSDVPGDCPKDKISLVKVGYYYCPECYMSDSLPGKCKMCGAELKKME